MRGYPTVIMTLKESIYVSAHNKEQWITPPRSIIANLLRMLFTLCVKGDYLYMSGGFCKYLVRTFLKQFCIPCSSEQGIHEYPSLTHGYSYMPCAAPADSTGVVRHHIRRRHGRSQSAGAQAYISVSSGWEAAKHNTQTGTALILHKNQSR